MVNEPPEGIESRPLAQASRILQGGPVALVTTFDRGRPNVAPVAWLTPLSANPPLVGIAIERSRHSSRMIARSEQFAINVPARPLLHHVQYLGALSGARIDKLEATQFETFEAEHTDAPLLTGCLAWVECEVQQAVPTGDHTLFVGLVRAVRVDPRAFGERWTLHGSADERPLHFLGDHYYATLDTELEARLPNTSDAPERVLQERLLEELEQTREAQERRAEALGALEREVEAGNIVDIASITSRTTASWMTPGGLVIPSPDDLPPLDR
jgi:flavin reductase (DIM6/NTAB) family NADH-FMN oxidoreductase RutF